MNGDQWLNQAEFSVRGQLALLLLLLLQMQMQLLLDSCWGNHAADAALAE
jgi:hypothetical protein